jgi:hypothetical protein
MVLNLVAEYDRLLEEIQNALQARHHDKWVSVLRGWREELRQGNSKGMLGAHAKRTARSLGGMESIGEIAQTHQDERLLKLVESLFAKCEEVIKANSV